MNESRDIRWKVDLLLMLIVLPLIGLVVSGKPVLDYLEFPPLTRYVRHAGFSWPVFLAVALFILAVVGPFVRRVLTSKASDDKRLPTRKVVFPWWGWFGLGLTEMAWIMAWTRFSWFAPLQIFTFTPIWIGYVLVVNGLTYKRTGHCMLRDRPGYLLGLFVMSAVFWWYFEYLNRFVQNWYYVGIGSISRAQYARFATLSFSTVLPAVLSTKDLLASMPRLSAGMDDFYRIRIRHRTVPAWLALAISSAGLVAIGIWPDTLFPILWLSPLFIITSLQVIRGQKTIFSDTADGKWRNIYLLALSALICGFFWELWNDHSLAKWVYAVPYVSRFKIFEMPILGYTGYLPFGLECAVVAEFMTQRYARSHGCLDMISLGRDGCPSRPRTPRRGVPTGSCRDNSENTSNTPQEEQ